MRAPASRWRGSRRRGASCRRGFVRSPSPAGGATLWEANQRLSTLRQTSPWSTGVSSWVGVEPVGAATRARPRPCTARAGPAPTARERRLLSTPKMRVALRVALRQEGAVQHLAGVAALEDAQLVAGLLLERGLHVLRDRERVVGDEDDVPCLRRLAVPGRGAGGSCEHRPRAPRRARREAPLVTRSLLRAWLDGERGSRARPRRAPRGR